MNYTIIRYPILVAIAFSLFQSDSYSAEESYKRFTVRNWTYRDGTQATGKLISVSGSLVTLRLEGKGTVRVPLEKLSVKDLNWIYEYHKRKKQLSFLPPKYRKLQVESTEPKPETPSSEKAESSPSQPEKSKSTEIAKPNETAKEESYKAFTVREWTSKDGRKYNAKFMSLFQGNVSLFKEPGGYVKVPLDRLSKKDLDWVVEYHRRKNLLTLLPAEFRPEKTTSKPSANTPDKPVTNPNSKSVTLNAPKGLAERMAENKAKAAALEEKHKKELAQKDPNDDPNVIKANTEIDPALVTALTGYRVWSDKKGQKSEAMFMGINGREVTFSLRAAGIVRIPVGTLIDEDLQLLRDALKMHGRLYQLPLVYREPLDPNLSPIRRKQLIRVNNNRKWTDLSGKSMGASYVKMEDGQVFLINTKTSAQQQFPYLNFSPEDQAYVQERLKKEVPGQFFPEGADSTLTPEEKEKEFRVWIDRSNRKIKGKFVRLAYGKSVAVINTGKKEELFITEFFSDQDLSLIKPKPRKQTDQLALNNGNNMGAGIPRGMNPGFPGARGMNPGFPNAGGMNRGMAGQFPGNNMPGNNTMPGRNQIPSASNPSRELAARMNSANPGTNHRRPPESAWAPAESESQKIDIPNSQPVFTQSNEKTYQCYTCKKTYTAEGYGDEAPCPYCNKKSHVSGYRIGRALRGIVTLVLVVGGFIAGGMKLRG